MRVFGLILAVTCMAAAPAAAAAQADPASGQAEAARRANEYAANRALISRLTSQRASLDRRLAYLQRDLQALVDWQTRCRAMPSDCPPPPEPPFPMVGMAPGHARPAVPQISLALLQQQRATIAQLREEIRRRTGLVGRLESQIAALRAGQ